MPVGQHRLERQFTSGRRVAFAQQVNAPLGADGVEYRCAEADIFEGIARACLQVKKRELEISAVSPAITATAATVNITLDFSEEETYPGPASKTDITTTRPDLFFDTDEKDTTTPNTNKEENPALLDL